jgi:hypothetical protein
VSLQKKLIFQQNAGDSSAVFGPKDRGVQQDTYSKFVPVLLDEMTFVGFREFLGPFLQGWKATQPF